MHGGLAHSLGGDGIYIQPHLFGVLSHPYFCYAVGDVMANTIAHCWCDNMAVVQVINSLSSRSERVMWLVRVFTLRCLHNLLFLARHALGVANGVTDTVSRKQMEWFRQFGPEANLLLARLPLEIWRLGG